MARRVVITGLGPVSALGAGIGPTWEAVVQGRSGIAPLTVFDPAGFAARLSAEVRDFKVTSYVPKSYRKAVKVMARDIELAVAAADLAARDAALVTRGNAPEGESRTSYAPTRVGAHIGAGLIAAEVNELTEALASSTAADGAFDIHQWGAEGMNQLTPLWLLKYLPNMLACHVTIIHDTQGPSNTITCGDASGGLSIGESLRVIQRGDADACFCGGAESKLNPMAFFRQLITGRLNTTDNDKPASAVRPFSADAAGTVIGEGGGIVVLESIESFEQRAKSVPAGQPAPRAYCELAGFGASQSVNLAARNLKPDTDGKGVRLAIQAAMRDAGVTAADIDLVVPFGLGWRDSDESEAQALRKVFGDRRVPVASLKPMLGNTGAATGGIDVCVAAKAVAEQTLPARINCPNPLPGIDAGTAPSRGATIRHALVYASSLGGQNAALVLRKV